MALDPCGFLSKGEQINFLFLCFLWGFGLFFGGGGGGVCLFWGLFFVICTCFIAVFFAFLSWKVHSKVALYPIHFPSQCNRWKWKGGSIRLSPLSYEIRVCIWSISFELIHISVCSLSLFFFFFFRSVVIWWRCVYLPAPDYSLLKEQ